MDKDSLHQTTGTSGAARILGITEKHVRLKANAGQIPHIRDHRGDRVFDVSELKAMVALRKLRAGGRP